MQNNKNLYKAKALAFTNSLRAVERDDQSASPSGIFGTDYNDLRKNVITEFPDLAKFMPPAVNFDPDFGNVSQSYSELDTFCEQIFQLLSEFSD